jgi:hypothetical protein
VMVVLMLTTNGANRRFQFQKRGQLFIGVHDETPSVAAMRVHNPDRSPASMIPLPKCRMIRHNPFNDSAFIGLLTGSEASISR